jgi:hypothetical protein
LGKASPRPLSEVSDDLPITAIPRRIYYPSVGEKSYEHHVARVRHRTLLVPWRVSPLGLANAVPGDTDTASPVDHARHSVRAPFRHTRSVFALPTGPVGSTALLFHQNDAPLEAREAKATELGVRNATGRTDGGTGNAGEGHHTNRRANPGGSLPGSSACNRQDRHGPLAC